jgi:hypothetical protein
MLMLLVLALCSPQVPNPVPFHNLGVLSQIQNWRPGSLWHNEPSPFVGKAHLIARPVPPVPKWVEDACTAAYATDRLKLNADYETIWGDSLGELNAELQYAHYLYVDCMAHPPTALCQSQYDDLVRLAWKAWTDKYTALRLTYAEDVIVLDLGFYDCLGG